MQDTDLFLIMVEGIHDAAFMRRMLLKLDFERVRHRSDLDARMHPLIPAAPQGLLVSQPPPADFYRRDLPVPQCVAVMAARGVERLIRAKPVQVEPPLLSASPLSPVAYATGMLSTITSAPT